MNANKTVKINGKTFIVKATPYNFHVNFSVHDERYAETPIIRGSVKWDGCSNWHFPLSETLMFHGCDRADLEAFGELMAICWDMTQDLCAHADRSLFEQKMTNDEG